MIGFATRDFDLREAATLRYIRRITSHTISCERGRLMNHRFFAVVSFLIAVLLIPSCVNAQAGKSSAVPGQPGQNLRGFVKTPGVSGYENQLADRIRAELNGLNPATDNIGDITVTLGSGAPHQLIVAPIDEPGYVVSDITEDGYLRVQRLPQFILPPIFNELYSAQPVKVETASGRWIDGVVTGLSVHLQPGRTDAPKSGDVENIYVDIGASSAAEARKAGVDNLSPIVINRRLMELNGWAMLAGGSGGDRFRAAGLVELLHRLDSSKLKGTLTAAFVVQQWTGARGLLRVLTTTQADEMIYVGGLLPGGPLAGA